MLIERIIKYYIWNNVHCINNEQKALRLFLINKIKIKK